MRALVPWLVLVPGLLATQGPQTRKTDPRKELGDLARGLDAALAAKNTEEAFKLIRAFAAAHRPAEISVELLSPDKKVQIVIGVSGTAARPDAPDVEFTPKGTAYSIAVGGDGGRPAKGAGGKGGTIWLKAKAKGKVLLLGGAGGAGADAKEGAGGNGGAGGDVWFGTFGVGDVHCQGGPGGTAGTGPVAGAGGNGGSGGPEPPKKR